MDLSRREVVRRLAGLATAASLWASTLFVLDDEIPSIVGGRNVRNNSRRNMDIPRRRTAGATTTTSGTSTTTTDPTTTTSARQAKESTTTSAAAEDTTTTTHGEHDHESTTTEAALQPVSAVKTITGTIGPVEIPAGEHWRLAGDVTLTGDLMVAGVLSNEPAGSIDGQGKYGIHAHGGGRLQLEGSPKSAWARWGESASGWSGGDRLAVAPTGPGVYDKGQTSWGGSWGSTARPGGCEAVALPSGTIQPEVVNMSQTFVIKGVTRLMMMEPAGAVKHVLRSIRIVDSGVAGKLGFYPLHFHRMGNATRGTVVEDVVVEGGRNHAFVVHGSHGVTLRRCVAVDTTNDVFWWDTNNEDASDARKSDDIVYDRCGVLGARPADGKAYITGFMASESRTRNQFKQCWAAGVRGGNEPQGFHWPGFGNAVWENQGCVAHNCAQGVRWWENSISHLAPRMDGFTAYRNGRWSLMHGAYGNPMRVFDSVLVGPATVHVAGKQADAGWLTGMASTVVDADGADFCIEFAGSNSPETMQFPIDLTNCDLNSARGPAIRIASNSKDRWLVLRDVRVNGNPIEPGDISKDSGGPWTVEAYRGSDLAWSQTY